MKIALIGNQNSGKTTLFNKLTGMNQKVGNWPGVTVEKREGIMVGTSYIITDLPGVYSLSPYTVEEKISRDFLLKEKPELIINVVDATNIERSLYLTTQLLELDCRIIIALNMIDIVTRRGVDINTKKLSEQLGTEVCEISAKTGLGIDSLIKRINVKRDKIKIKIFDEQIEEKISEVADTNMVNRFTALNMIEGNMDSADESTNIIRKSLESIYEEKMDEIIATQRYCFIGRILGDALDSKKLKCRTTSKLDNVFLNKYLSFPLFVCIMFLVYYLSVGVVGKFMSDFLTTQIAYMGNKVSEVLILINTSEILVSLICDGIICGVGTVISFVPQLIVLFFFISVLEATGYMSRMAFLLDNLFKKFGLSGKSLVPFVVGLGCSVPGIMASRILEKRTQRDKTVILTPFIPCSAKLPIIALFSGYFFPEYAEFVAVSFYFLSILIICISAYIMGKFKQKYEDSVYIDELPEYKLPSIKYIIKDLTQKTKSFLRRAGSIILICSILVWFLLSFSTQLEYDVSIENSILANVGKRLSYFFYPIIGENSWEATVSILQGIIAKEQVVSSMSIISGVAASEKEFSNIFDRGGVFDFFTPQTAYAFVVFNLFTVPCFGAVATMRKELGSNAKTLKAVVFQILIACVAAIIARSFAGVFC